MISEYRATLTALQQPGWQDDPRLGPVISNLESEAPLVQLNGVNSLKDQQAKAADGKAFTIQAGPCAEMFSDGKDSTAKLVRTILPMKVALMYSSGLQITTVGRIGGQFAKPRSSDTEEVGGVILPSYRGDMANIDEPNLPARTSNPERMLQSYYHAEATIKYLNDLTKGGYADLATINQWNRDFIDTMDQNEQDRYLETIERVAQAIRFIGSVGMDLSAIPAVHETTIYTSHEALFLDYEDALTRVDELGKSIFASSAHMLWIGERTRALDQAHVAFAARVVNPIGAKLSPTATPEDVIGLCLAVNPKNEPGKLTFIPRMGAGQIEKTLPHLIRAAESIGHHPTWMSDPMHGNTFTSPSGAKTRDFSKICSEVTSFFKVSYGEGVSPGGVHVELTGEDVTECIGGSGRANVTELSERYETSCDPRLNGGQGMELAFHIADLLECKP